ncbi:hypothetical protein N865_14375 [Intrasporangium oryzae NRRL B-24470]|uniref:Uncharacterized protein n=1 Tax=Intrasporangium oryzae NRRL B-24470 TaxID=1386089 RepID=W9G9U7_9MICO|nr:hypothetical protein N865_14375 [Intrasporangium oryzae NRRL B-24470]
MRRHNAASGISMTAALRSAPAYAQPGWLRVTSNHASTRNTIAVIGATWATAAARSRINTVVASSPTTSRMSRPIQLTSQCRTVAEVPSVAPRTAIQPTRRAAQAARTQGTRCASIRLLARIRAR